MANQSQIRWKRSDYITLGKAVSNFNKRIKELEKLDLQVNLPKQLNYQELKNNIYTRRKLQQTINSLKSIMKEDAITPINGITKWEADEFKRRSRIASRRLNKELKEAKSKEEISQIKTDLQSLSNIRKIATGKTKVSLASLNYYRGRSAFLGSSEYGLRKAINFKEKYIEAIKNNYTNIKGGKEFIDKLEKIKDPFEFYNRIKDNEAYKDITMLYYGRGTARGLNDLLEAWGIETEENYNILD